MWPFSPDGPDIMSPMSTDARERIEAKDPTVVDMRSWYAEEYRRIVAGEPALTFSWVGLQTCCAQLHVADVNGVRHVTAEHSLARQTSTGMARSLFREAGLSSRGLSGYAAATVRGLFTGAEKASDAAVCSIIMHTRKYHALGKLLELRAFGLSSEHLKVHRYRDQVHTERTGFIDPGRLTVVVPREGAVRYVLQGSLEEHELEPKPVQPGLWSGVAGTVSGSV